MESFLELFFKDVGASYEKSCIDDILKILSEL